MKNLIVTIALIAGLSASAQGSTFDITVSDWETYGSSTAKFKHLEFQPYVVIEKEGTVEELYEAVKLYIDLTWNDPNHVVKVDRPNELIRVNGAHDRIYEFRFKEGKIKYSTNLPKYYVAMKKPNGKIKKEWAPVFIVIGSHPPLSRIGSKFGYGMAKRYQSEENARILVIKNIDLIEDANNDW